VFVYDEVKDLHLVNSNVREVGSVSAIILNNVANETLLQINKLSKE